MSKLTKEQIDEAAKALYEQFNGEYGKDGVLIPYKYSASPDNRKAWYQSVVASLAPYLQYPWGQPTEEDALTALAAYENDIHFRNNKRHAMESVLRWLVAFRNAALLPKPDPRREKIIEKMKQVRDSRKDVVRADSDAYVEEVLGKYADAILKALDEAVHDDQ